VSRERGAPGRLPRFLRFLADPALGSAWERLVGLWRPMMGWALLVWVVLAVVLGPLSSVLLGWSWLTGREEVVANEALLAWGLTPQGLIWIVVAGSLALVGAVLHFAGVFEIVTGEMEGMEPSVPETALRLAPRVPALVRLCGAAVLAGLVLALPAAAGLAGIHALFLGAQDINYYLAERPPAWWNALASAGVWLAAWALLAAWLAGRSVMALPAYLDGHRPLAAAVHRSWRTTRGEGGRILRVVAMAVAGWLLVRFLVNAAAVAGGTTLVGWIGSLSDSLRPMVAATGGWALLTLAVDAAVGFLGIAYISTVLTKLYHEETDLHARASAGRTVGIAELPGRVRGTVVRWLQPARFLPALGLALVGSWVAGGLLLERMPDPRPVAITAHRAGPPPAPENTLAALERSVAAGADRAEIDVQLTRDDVPVVVHDADLMRMAGDRRRISRTDYADLSEVVQGPDDGSPSEERRVATLAEFLERAGGRIGLVVELKYYGWDPDLAREVVRVVREEDATDRVLVMSLDLRAVRQLRASAPEVPVGYAAAAAVGDPSRLPVDFLALSRPASTPALLRSARRRGVEVHVWTVNRAVAMAEVIQEGADGLITDRPRLAVRVREELADLPAASRLLLRFGHLLGEIAGDEEAYEEL
jgi:glycerophosphoryl diester phosphodiesterase